MIRSCVTLQSTLFSCFWKIQVFFSQLWLQLILYQDLFKRNILAHAARIWSVQLTLSLGLDDSRKNIYIRIKSFELVNIFRTEHTWNVNIHGMKF